MSITTVLFDLDDTLFDHIGTARAALAATAATDPRLRAADPEALYQHYCELLEEIHTQLLAGRYTYEEARQLRFERLLGPYGVGAAEVPAIAQAHYGRYQQLRRPLPGARALLEALKPHYRIGVVTNNRTVEQVDKLRHLGLEPFVDVLITSEDVGVPKPDPRIFQAALARLGARPAEAVLVGDNWTADAVGALGAGIRPVWLNRTGAPRPLAHVQELAGLAPLPAVWQTITGRAYAGAGAPVG
ncbi:HAD family hydrolase [Hymenobacter caeli]|uniref:Hydrolase of the HAD superfamily n=1 Tax=Hymenobacter caeli TaxID=2735894 RepID=A0ABX2FY34_9BACT|nr:HAD family hydrolase [Hymenobacter caeli]NRT21184.1 putative hydrolase of the HAD superfamily [Hymenobacter caeli]